MPGAKNTPTKPLPGSAGGSRRSAPRRSVRALAAVPEPRSSPHRAWVPGRGGSLGSAPVFMSTCLALSVCGLLVSPVYAGAFHSPYCPDRLLPQPLPSGKEGVSAAFMAFLPCCRQLQKGGVTCAFKYSDKYPQGAGLPQERPQAAEQR